MLQKKEREYKQMPVVRNLDKGIVQRNYLQIKNEVKEIVEAKLARINNDPELAHLFIVKQK